MKKAVLLSLFSFALIFSAKAQNTCYAYGHHKVTCPNSSTEQKTVAPKADQKTVSEKDKKVSSANIQSKTIRKYNATAFKTKRYFFKSL